VAVAFYQKASAKLGAKVKGIDIGRNAPLAVANYTERIQNFDIDYEKIQPDIAETRRRVNNDVVNVP